MGVIVYTLEHLHLFSFNTFILALELTKKSSHLCASLTLSQHLHYTNNVFIYMECPFEYSIHGVIYTASMLGKGELTISISELLCES